MTSKARDRASNLNFESQFIFRILHSDGSSLTVILLFRLFPVQEPIEVTEVSKNFQVILNVPMRLPLSNHAEPDTYPYQVSLLTITYHIRFV
jgi:hypothetical protein